MYRITSHQPADLFFPGPSRLHPERGAVTLKMGTHDYAELPVATLERFEAFEDDGLITFEPVVPSAVAS